MDQLVQITDDEISDVIGSFTCEFACDFFVFFQKFRLLVFELILKDLDLLIVIDLVYFF